MAILCTEVNHCISGLIFEIFKANVDKIMSPGLPRRWYLSTCLLISTAYC